MPMVQAFCNFCGTMFPSGIFIENEATVSLLGNIAGPCPKCGGFGHTPDGIFRFFGNTIEIISAPERTIDELKRFSKILEEAKSNYYSEKTLSEKVKQNAPEFLSILDLLPKNRSDLYAFLALLLAIIQMIMSTTEKPSQNITNNIYIRQVVEKAYQDASYHEGKKITSKKNKIGRNEICQCGSNKKYKKCCGSSNKSGVEETKYLNSIPNLGNSIQKAMKDTDSEFTEEIKW